MYIPWDALARRDVMNTAATVMVLPALSSLMNLVSVTLASILQVVVMCLAGYILARRGVLDKKTQTKLNKLNVSILTPALLFSKVAFSLTPERLTELAIVPLGFVIVSLVSALSSITPNSNTLPVALIQSLVGTVPELHWKRNGQDTDTPDDMLGRALTYLVLFSTLGTVQRWSIASNLLAKVSNEAPPHLHQRTGTGFTDDVTDFLVDDVHRDHLATASQISEHEPYRDDPAAPQSEDRHVHFAPPRASILRRVGGVLRHVVRVVLEFMTVPLWAAVASFIVALTPPLQRTIVSMTSLVGALQQLGGCSIPLTILVLGAYFSADIGATPEQEPSDDGASDSDTPDYSWRTIIAASTARMILTPLILVPMLAYLCIASRSNVVDDPVFIACACLVIGSPPALTLAQITSQRGNPNSNVEYLISGTIFVSYIVLTAPTTVGLVMAALAIDEVQDRFMLLRTLAWPTA
ncbi:hypothetical protein MBRA1_000760 [Malassezia brasiliensis]|uniref:Auxin efflux carrier n=1 Tax=Malassezia brasiliensis TaxID=1821822 RepID=A0AAF0IRP1_9BASI|nr:hypothetical protein MBRA1_000760 [Malassezia brasiliensis]